MAVLHFQNIIHYFKSAENNKIPTQICGTNYDCTYYAIYFVEKNVAIFIDRFIIIIYFI